METLITFIAQVSFILYALIGIGIFFSIRGLVLSRRSRRVAVFGLEKEKAQQSQQSALNTIVFLLMLAVGVYIISAILEPNLDTSVETFATPTSEIFITAAPSPTAALVLYPTITATPGLPPAEAGDQPAEPAEPVDGCAIIGSNISSPTTGTTVSGQVTVEGEANVFDFAQYKFEVRSPATSDQWVVVGTFNQPRTGFLGTWDSTSLSPGEYVLRLVVSQNSGNIVTPCEVPITITRGAAAPAEDQ
jgi:hypothetical protein